MSRRSLGCLEVEFGVSRRSRVWVCPRKLGLSVSRVGLVSRELSLGNEV
jgi:hypothetical protein